MVHMNSLIEQMQIWVAHSSVASSTVRGQKQGLVRRMRSLLAETDLSRYSKCHPSRFASLLDAETNRIYRKMPPASQHWGIARKTLNIFLRCAAYNVYLRERYDLRRLEPAFELPLDSLTANGLRRVSPRGTLPRWTRLTDVTPEINERFQDRARVIASERGLYRVHLDLFLWLDR
jgi:hypothetical protein